MGGGRDGGGKASESRFVQHPATSREFKGLAINVLNTCGEEE